MSKTTVFELLERVDSFIYDKGRFEEQADASYGHFCLSDEEITLVRGLLLVEATKVSEAQASAASVMFRQGEGGKFTSDQKVKVKDGEV